MRTTPEICPDLDIRQVEAGKCLYTWHEHHDNTVTRHVCLAAEKDHDAPHECACGQAPQRHGEASADGPGTMIIIGGRAQPHNHGYRIEFSLQLGPSFAPMINGAIQADKNLPEIVLSLLKKLDETIGLDQAMTAQVTEPAEVPR